MWSENTPSSTHEEAPLASRSAVGALVQMWAMREAVSSSCRPASSRNCRRVEEPCATSTNSGKRSSKSAAAGSSEWMAIRRRIGHLHPGWVHEVGDTRQHRRRGPRCAPEARVAEPPLQAAPAIERDEPTRCPDPLHAPGIGWRCVQTRRPPAVWSPIDPGTRGAWQTPIPQLRPGRKTKDMCGPGGSSRSTPRSGQGL